MSSETMSDISTEGNSISQCSPALNWVFTWNNYEKCDSDWYNTLISIDSSVVPTLVFQEEIGENGTPHIQGAFSFKNKNRPFSLGLPKEVHFELGLCHVAKNKSQRVTKLLLKAAREYACKESTRKPNGIVYKRGFVSDEKYKVYIENKYEWQEEIVARISENPDKRTVLWIWGNGNVGKTHFQKYLFTNGENVIILEGKTSDCKNAIVDYVAKNKKYPRTILINVTRDEYKGVSYSCLEKVKDMLFYSGKYEGGMICGPNPHVIVFANNPPNLEKLSGDRWWIRKIDDGKLIEDFEYGEVQELDDSMDLLEWGRNYLG